MHGPLMTAANPVVVLSVALVVLGRYGGITEVDASNNFRHRQRDTQREDDVKPYFKSTNQNVTVHPGERAVLRCRVENLGTKTVSWRKQGEVNPLTIGFFTFSPDTRLKLDYNNRMKEWSLIIQATKPEDEGWYHCQVTTKDDPELYYPVKLNVLTVQITGTDYVVVGSQLQLMCNATGKPDPPHNVEWYKDDQPLRSDAQKGIIITKKIETKVLVSMLVIKEVQLSDQADYTCRSSNQDSAEFTLNVLDPIMPVPGKSDQPGNQGSNSYEISPRRATAYHYGSGSSPTLYTTRTLYSTIATVVVCLCTTLLFVDTRWRS